MKSMLDNSPSCLKCVHADPCPQFPAEYNVNPATAFAQGDHSATTNCVGFTRLPSFHDNRGNNRGSLRFHWGRDVRFFIIGSWFHSSTCTMLISPASKILKWHFASNMPISIVFSSVERGAGTILYKAMVWKCEIHNLEEQAAFPLWCCCWVAKLCPTFFHPMDCSPPGSSVHAISKARILEWVAISFCMGSSGPRDWTHVSCIVGKLFTAEPPGKLLFMISDSKIRGQTQISWVFFK